MPKRMDDADLPPVVMPSCAIRKTLSGQEALVTGASSGIGRGVALALGQAGADVVVNYHSGEEEAEEVAAAIRHDGGNAYAHQADVSQEDQVQAMFAKMIADFGTIDISKPGSTSETIAVQHFGTLRYPAQAVGSSRGPVPPAA